MTSGALGDSAAIVRELEVLADDSVAGGYSEAVARKAIAHILAIRALLSSVEDGEGIVRELGGFTPGPWEWNGKDQLWGGERGEAGALEQILNSADDGKSYGMHSACIEHHWDEKVAEANRRLIAAAPTLLARITLDAQEKAALQGQADVLDALNTSQAHEIALLKAELARLKEVAHNNAERSNANYVAMQSALEFIDLTIERREAFAEYRAAHPKE